MYKYAIHELIAHKLLPFIGLLAIIPYGIGYFLINFTPGGHHKILFDYTLASFQLFSVCMPLLCVIPFINRHEKHGLFSFFLFSGIHRHQCILGCWVGCIACMLIVCLLYYLCSILFLYLLLHQWALFLFPAFITMLFEGIFLVTMALFFALVCQQSLAMMCVVGVFIICHTSHEWFILLQKESTHFTKAVATMIYYALPDLRLLDIKSAVMHQLPINWLSIALNALYLLLFSLIFLIGALIVFKRKALN